MGEEFGCGGAGEGAVGSGEEDFGGGGAELVDGLAAGPAGLAGGVVEIDDDDGFEANSGAVEGDGGSDGGLLGASGESVGGVFNITADDDVSVFEEECGADAEVAVGGVGVRGNSEGAMAEVFDLRRRHGAGCVVLRHGCEAIGCCE